MTDYTAAYGAPSTTTITNPSLPPVNQAPCPSCDYCPTCGRSRNTYQPSWQYIPTQYVWPSTTWYSMTTDSSNTNANQFTYLNANPSAGEPMSVGYGGVHA